MFSFSQANNRGSGPVASQSQICSGRSTNCPSQAAQAPLMTDENEENDDEGAWLQLRPVEPLPSQCCGSGCSPCVFDLYHRELARWEAARASKDRSLLNGEEPQSCPSRLSPETFLAFRISAMDRLTEDTYRVRFAVPRNSQLGLRPGQHLILRGKVDDLEIQRAYTPISPANAEGYFEVLIKCYETGLMSRYVKSWSTGDTTFWRGPFGDFFYKPNQHGELLMLASGTGLAPMVPVLQSITDNAEDETFVTLVGCFKTFEGIYLKTFLQEQARFWNVRTFFVLSQVSPAWVLPSQIEAVQSPCARPEDLLWPPCPTIPVISAAGGNPHPHPPVPCKEGRYSSVWVDAGTKLREVKVQICPRCWLGRSQAWSPGRAPALLTMLPAICLWRHQV
uniref:NADH-cytochrome b5 reductase-like n=1 Tax=Canis lupus familiaris TaxID=9615 RepID=A0A8C0Q2C5_CANLF